MPFATPLCYNLNENVCKFFHCKYVHACSYCGHPKSVCLRRTRFMKKERKKYIHQTINVPKLGRALRNHPNRCFVNYLITSLVQGFIAGLSWMPDCSLVCKILLSVLKEPEPQGNDRRLPLTLPLLLKLISRLREGCFVSCTDLMLESALLTAF